MTTQNDIKKFMGKTYTHTPTGETIKFIDFKLTGDIVTIITDLENVKVSIYDFKLTMKEYVPIEQNEVQIITTPSKMNSSPLKVADDETISKLKTILLDDIDKVRSDPSYVPRAKTAIDGVKAIIELAKVEIMLKRDL